ncbi:hypothetical protein [Chitinophaga sp.]|uniref:hypothetical protein n=1 Tax=Chitinophaga sp. TaxID=1869181 RepID=UPI002F954D0F
MTPVELVKFVSSTFKSYRNNTKIIERLTTHDVIHPSFEMRYLINNIDFDFELEKIVTTNGNIVEAYLDAADGSPYRLEMIFDGKWYLKSYLFLCQGCLSEDSTCLVCGGSGWGVL